VLEDDFSVELTGLHVEGMSSMLLPALIAAHPAVSFLPDDLRPTW
jgi:hypothetical protein